MSFDTIIFQNKTLADMFSDVYKNTETKRAQINEYIKNMVKLIRSPEDAAMLGPIIKDFLEVNVKNDEHIVKLVSVAQRLVALNAKGSDNSDLLTEEDKNQLLSNIKTDFDALLTETSAFEDKLTDAKIYENTR